MSMSILTLRRESVEACIEQLIALLDLLDGDPDLEDGGDAEPSIGTVGQYIGGEFVYDLEDDPAELGIADNDALHLTLQEDDWGSSTLRFTGDGHHMGRKLLRDHMRDQRKFAKALDATRACPGRRRFK